MKINLQQRLLTFSQAANLLPGRPHRSTLIRWATRGVHGVKLETIRIGGRRFVSEDALERFITAVTDTTDRSCSRAADKADEVDRAADEAGRRLDATVFGRSSNQGPKRRRGATETA